ncbi:MAG: YvcK family protein, partial [Blastocatellia bacterium]|nr:YvcK family protein [Blastocatellia bacterium]
MEKDSINLVAIGGGTGLASLLSGLKHYVNDGRNYDNFWGISLAQLTAVVTVTDDGGSSGRLREEFHILPPGDIRNCMVALSED